MIARIAVLAILAGGLAAVPAAIGQDPPKLKPDDPAAKLPDALRQKVSWNKDLKDTPLFELLADLAKRYDVTFIIMEESFKAEGVQIIRDAKPNVPAARLNGLSLGAFLDTALQSVGATYVVRPDYIEITTPARRIQEKAARVFPVADLVADPTAPIVSVLHEQQVSYEKQLNDTPMFELLQDLGRRYAIAFVIRDELFKAVEQPNFRESKPNLSATRLEGLSLHRFLTVILQDLDAAYLVRGKSVEIVPRKSAQAEAGLFNAVAEAKAGGDPVEVARAESRLNLPLVCVLAENRPALGVITELARQYDVNVVIDQGAQTVLKGSAVSARLLNVPADTALEMLAAQVGASVMRKGNAFRIVGGGM